MAALLTLAWVLVAGTTGGVAALWAAEALYRRGGAS